MANQNVMEALEALLQKGVDASQAETRRTRLDEVRDKDPADWDEGEWDFANERGLIPPEYQGEYEMRLLEKRQAAERAQLLGWQGGNLPTTGTATQGVASGQMPVPPQNPVSAQLGMKVEEVEGHEEAPAGADDRPYEDLTYNELKKLAKSRSLDTSGSQEDLVARLKYDDETS